MNRDMPSISSGTYSSNVHNMAALGVAHGGLAALNNNFGLFDQKADAAELEAQIRRFKQQAPPVPNVAIPTAYSNQEKPTMTTRRLVQVFIADPNENVPLTDSLLYSGEQKLTDATDQELFFEIDINSILKAHNEKRVKMIDKKVKERTEYLDPAKIRDLKMVVVNVAGF